MSTCRTRRETRGAVYPSTAESKVRPPLPSLSGCVRVHVEMLKADKYAPIDMSNIVDVDQLSESEHVFHKLACLAAVSNAIDAAQATAKKDCEAYTKKYGSLLTGGVAVNRALQQRGDAMRAEDARKFSPHLELGALIEKWKVVKGIYVSRASTRPRLVVDVQCNPDKGGCGTVRMVRACDVTGGKTGGCDKCNRKAQQVAASDRRRLSGQAVA